MFDCCRRCPRPHQYSPAAPSHRDLVENGSSEDEDRPLAARAGKPAQGTLDAFVKKQAAASPKSPGKAAAAAKPKPKPARKRAAADSGELLLQPLLLLIYLHLRH